MMARIVEKYHRHLWGGEVSHYTGSERARIFAAEMAA